MRRRARLALFPALAAALLAASCFSPERAPEPASPESAAGLADLLGGEDSRGFARALAPRPFRFPRDHGAHPRYRSEWWYLTGNLETGGGRRFGYQLTLFRQGLRPGTPARASAWATRQIYMGHLALTDTRARRFHFFQRFARGAAGLAGARTEPLRIWLEDWSLESDDPERLWTLRAREPGGIALELELRPAKPVVLQGENGLSRKSAAPGNATYYYSLPRLRTRGRIRVGDEHFAVNGLSWLDREWGTSALAKDQAGWDWFALQLDDGTELMLYHLRRRQGGIDPFSAGTFILPDGRHRSLGARDFRIEILDYWDSPRGGRYPSGWRLRIHTLGLDLQVRPILRDQELDTIVRYWEGAVDVEGTRRGRPLGGRGYAELTGYAGG